MEVQMVAYWVARSKVNNLTQYKKYTDLVPSILQKFGGRILARGGRFKILEGPERFRRFVLIEFPSPRWTRSTKRQAQSGNLAFGGQKMVDRGRIELPTPGFSVPCSTN
jgi:uncharacterized protein (DUF1330 family)